MAVKLLDCFNGSEPLRLADLHQRTGLNKSRILRLVGSLEAAGVVVLDESTGRYRLGPKLYYLGRLAERRYLDLVASLRPRLLNLAQQTGGVAYLSVREGHHRLVLVRCRADGVAERVIKDGQVRPLHLGANGRVFLAFEPTDVKNGLLARFAHDPDIGIGADIVKRIKTLLPGVRKEGHAIAFGETKPGHIVVAAPVLGRDGGLLATLAISLPGGQAKALIAAEHARLLKEEATLLSGILGDAIEAARPAFSRRVASPPKRRNSAQ